MQTYSDSVKCVFVLIEGLCKENNGGCSHSCLSIEDRKVECRCPHGLVLDSDQKTCISKMILVKPNHSLIIKNEKKMLNFFKRLFVSLLSKKLSKMNQILNIIRREDLRKECYLSFSLHSESNGFIIIYFRSYPKESVSRS